MRFDHDADDASIAVANLRADFGRDFDAIAADALLQQAGMADAVDRHIHVTVLGLAVREAAA